jgi:seryl-tRNA synthetase
MGKLTIKQIKRVSLFIDTEIEKTKENLIRIENERNSTLHEIGNLVHESVPVSNDEVKEFIY